MRAPGSVQSPARLRRLVVGAVITAMTVVPAVALAPQPASAVADGPSSYPNYLVTHAGDVWFSATTAADGTSLYKSDGTSGGTSLIAANIDPQNLHWVGNQLFFQGMVAGHPQLFVSDGTNAGTAAITTVNGGLYATGFVAFHGGVLFAGSDNTHSQEPWFSTGKVGGTRLVKDILPGPDSSEPVDFTPVGNGKTAVFAAYTTAHGEELWRTNGTTSGTALVKDIYPGPNSGISDSFFSFATYKKHAYFLADDGVTGYELWKTDSTSHGTHLVKNIGPGSTDMTDGEPTVQGGQINYLDSAVYRGDLWFAANDGKHGNELWRTNGTAKGTTLAVDVFKGARSAAPEDLTVVAGHLLFTAQDAAHGIEPWFTNGKRSSTHLIKDVYRGRQSSYGYGFVPVPGGVVFQAYDATHGGELWHSPIRAGHANLVDDIAPGEQTSEVGSLTRLGAKVVFTADDGTYGDELWVTDGAAGGTHLVIDLNA